MKKNSNGIGVFIGLVIASIFSGLILSLWALIAKRNGRGFLIQLIFALVCIIFFGFVLSYHLYIKGTGSGSDNEIFVYYIGMIGTYTNALASIIWITTLFVKTND